jgi:hypothetical protein
MVLLNNERGEIRSLEFVWKVSYRYRKEGYALNAQLRRNIFIQIFAVEGLAKCSLSGVSLLMSRTKKDFNLSNAICSLQRHVGLR